MAESHPASRRKLGTLACIGIIAVISGCSLQADYSPPAIEAPKQWLDAQDAARTYNKLDAPFPDRWWTALRDPAVDTLVLAALRDSPTVDEVVFRTDEARAVLGRTGAQRLPSIQVSANAARQQGAAAEAGKTELSRMDPDAL